MTAKKAAKTAAKKTAKKTPPASPKAAKPAPKKGAAPAKPTPAKVGKPAKKAASKSVEKPKVTKATKETKAPKTAKATKEPKAPAVGKEPQAPKAAKPAKPAAPVKAAAAPQAAKETAKAPAKSASKPKGKAGKSGKGASVVGPINTGRVTVQIGASRPMLSIAPGVMFQRKDNASGCCDASEASKVRKPTKKELADIRHALESKREELLHGIRKELKNSRQRSLNVSADPMDKATDSSDDDLSFEIASASDEELTDIDVALKKLDDGTYGVCESCGANISITRLKVLPFAVYCRECRNMKEQIQRREELSYGTFLGDDGEDEVESASEEE